jgi:hypothetical protein
MQINKSHPIIVRNEAKQQKIKEVRQSGSNLPALILMTMKHDDAKLLFLLLYVITSLQVCSTGFPLYNIYGSLLC